MGVFANRLHWGVALGLAAVAFALRAAGHGDVFVDESIVPRGEEAWYHLRRQVYALSRVPEVLRFDSFVRYASGAVAPWSPGFDALIGWVASLAGQGERIASARWLGVWSPVALSALAVLAVFGLVRRRHGVVPGAFAALTLALVPAHVTAGQIGYVNHRIAGTTLVLFAWLAALRALRPDGARPLALAVLGGVLGALALWLSMTALLPLLVLLTFLFGVAVWRPDQDAARGTIPVLLGFSIALLAATALHATRLPTAAADPLALGYPSRFHLLCFGEASLVALFAWVAWRGALGVGWIRRLIGLALFAGLLDAIAWWAIPGSREASLGFSATLVGDPSLHAAAREPALNGLGGLGALAAVVSFLGVLTPVLLVAAIVLVRGERRAESVGLCLASACFAGAAWFGTGGFAAAGLAVALAVGVFSGVLLDHLRGTGVRALVAVAVLAALLPGAVGALRSEAAVPGVEIDGARLDPQVVDNVLGWIQGHGRDGGRWFKPEVKPEYSVLAPWRMGHRLLYQARRAPVVDGFAPVLAPGRLDFARRFYDQPAFRAEKDLQRYETRYVLVPDVEGFPASGAGRDGALRALVEQDGGERDTPEPGDPFAISTLRLVYEYGERSEGGGLRVYEHVRGARAVGSSRPERIVRASLRLRSSTGREFTYRVSTFADPYWGTWELRLPYSTLETKRDRFVLPLGSWTIECEGETKTFDVPDWKVRDGGQVDAPGICY